MAKNYVQPGKVIDVTLTAAVTSGDVVIVGQTLGVALEDGAIGDEVSVQVDGVFEVPKKSAAVFAAGESLVWDVSATGFDDNQFSAGTGDVSGAAAVAFKAGANGETTALVKFTGVPGTVS